MSPVWQGVGYILSQSTRLYTCTLSITQEWVLKGYTEATATIYYLQHKLKILYELQYCPWYLSNKKNSQLQKDLDLTSNLQGQG